MKNRSSWMNGLQIKTNLHNHYGGVMIQLIKLKQRIKKNYLAFYMMLLPATIYLIMNNYIPMGGIVIVFKQVDFRKGILASLWVGFENFEFLFQNNTFKITRNTILYNLVFIVLGTVGAVTIAILLAELKNKYLSKISHILFLMPHLISMVIVSYLVNALLSTDNGFINNSILEVLGKETMSWYSYPNMALHSSNCESVEEFWISIYHILCHCYRY